MINVLADQVKNIKSVAVNILNDHIACLFKYKRNSPPLIPDN